MKSFTTYILAAAAMAVAAGSASAQNTLKAEIPFAFQTGKTIMQPGEYQVRLANHHTIRLYNVDARKAVFAMAVTESDRDKAWKDGTPRMAFECSDGTCALLALYTGEGVSALRFRGLESKAGDAHVAMVPLRILRK
jgi:hypothetical protein